MLRMFFFFAVFFLAFDDAGAACLPKPKQLACEEKTKTLDLSKSGIRSATLEKLVRPATPKRGS